MLGGDFAHDRQAQATAIALRIEHPVEALEDQAALGQRDARTAVLDFEYRAAFFAADPDRHAPAVGRVAQRVVDQIVEQLAQQDRMAGNRRRFVVVLVTEVDAAPDRRVRPFHHHRARQRRQIEGFEVRRIAQVFHAGQGQQLADQVRGPVRRDGQLLQAAAHLGRVGLAQRQFGLGAKAGERGLHLVGRIGDEALLRADSIVQTGQQLIEGVDQRRDLGRHAAAIDRREIVGLAVAQALLHTLQRRQPARQAEPDQADRQRQDHELREDHALDDLVGQLVALVLGFGDLDHHRCLSAGRLLRLDIGVGDAHFLAAEGVVAQLHHAGFRKVVQGRRRELRFAAQQFAIGRCDLERHIAFVGGWQQIAQLARGWQDAPGDIRLRLLGEHIGMIDQSSVEWRVGQRAGDHEGDGHRQRPEQQQGRQHPVENLAEQRTLLDGADGRGRPLAGPSGCRSGPVGQVRPGFVGGQQVLEDRAGRSGRLGRRLAACRQPLVARCVHALAFTSAGRSRQ